MFASLAARRATFEGVWPHTARTLTPDRLAHAGFYRDGEPADRVRCFVCGGSLCEWSASDDPMLEHIVHAPHCAWARAVCAEYALELMARRSRRKKWPAAVVEATQRLQDPMHPDAVAARVATFQLAPWPHADSPSLSASKMAAAGFILWPLEGSADNARCPCCEASLDAWEPDDDPWVEHRRRVPTCRFFAAQDMARAAPPSPLPLRVDALPAALHKRKCAGASSS